MIVLEDVGVMLAPKIDERGPAGEAHRHAKRKLMGGRDVNNFGRRLFRSLCDDYAFTINWSWNYRRSGETKSAASLVKSRIFDPCDFTSIHQRRGANHNLLLRS